jgi:hypothetical protein
MIAVFPMNTADLETWADECQNSVALTNSASRFQKRSNGKNQARENLLRQNLLQKNLERKSPLRKRKNKTAVLLDRAAKSHHSFSFFAAFSPRRSTNGVEPPLT